VGALDIALTADELEQLSVLRAAGDRYTDMSFVQGDTRERPPQPS
jgi:hypothetical protein